MKNRIANTVEDVLLIAALANLLLAAGALIYGIYDQLKPLFNGQ